MLNLRFFFADVDECQMTENICGANSICINYDGGFNCTCIAGFQMIDGSCLGEFYHVSVQGDLCPGGSLNLCLGEGQLCPIGSIYGDSPPESEKPAL